MLIDEQTKQQRIKYLSSTRHIYRFFFHNHIYILRVYGMCLYINFLSQIDGSFYCGIPSPSNNLILFFRFFL